MSNELQDLKEQLDRIERALVGDDEYGQFGIVKTINEHDKRISALERVGLYLAGGGAVIGLIWTVWSQWPRR